MTNDNQRNQESDIQKLLISHHVDGVQSFLKQPIFLMEEASFYNPTKDVREYVENKFTQTANDADFRKDIAIEETNKLKDLILGLGGSVVLNPGQDGLYDGVYKADPSVTMMIPSHHNGEINSVRFESIPSKFYNYARQPEVVRQMSDVAYLRDKLAEHFNFASSLHQVAPKLHCEGVGDNVYDVHRDLFWCGYKTKGDDFDPVAGRSDYGMHEFIAERFGMQGRTIPLEVNNDFFHIDTVLAPLPRGEVLCYMDGLTSASQDRLVQVVGEGNIHEVTEEEANDYACNLIVFDDNKLITSTLSKRLSELFKDRGYEHYQTPMHQFAKLSGGGVHCRVNRVNQMRTLDSGFVVPQFALP